MPRRAVIACEPMITLWKRRSLAHAVVWGRAQVIAELDRSPFSELRRYTATDITPAFGPNLLQMVGNPKLEFKVGTCFRV